MSDLNDHHNKIVEALAQLPGSQLQSDALYANACLLAAASKTETPAVRLTWREKRAWLERSAGLIFNVGSIIEDREVCNDDVDLERLWTYLYDRYDELYESLGRVIDGVEDELGLDQRHVDSAMEHRQPDFADTAPARPPFGSHPSGFTRV